MRNKSKEIIKTLLTVLISVLVVFTVVKAGTITPPSGAGEPSAKFYTLSEIYHLIHDNVTTATEGGHGFTFSDNLAGTSHTLTEIYNELKDLIDPSKLLSDTTYLGVPGSIAAGNDVTVTSSTPTDMPAGYYSGKTCSAALTGGTGSVAAAGQILSTYHAWNSTGAVLQGSISTQSLDPANDTVNVGYYAANTLSGVDADLVVGNIKKNIAIFGKTGTLYGDTDSTKVCSNASAAGTLTITAAYVSVGNTYCGTAGTLLANLFNGTGQGFTGGSQANGGVDDYNNNTARPSNSYSKGWTQCIEANDYCGTDTNDDGDNDSGADAKDDSTGLIWSMPCNGNGCISFSDSSPGTYTWDNSGTPGSPPGAAGNNGSTASALCSNQSGWSLPHQKQLMQAYIDGSWGNLEDVSLSYWSATTKSSTTTSAWITALSNGTTANTGKTNGYNVRCVRSAN